MLLMPDALAIAATWALAGILLLAAAHKVRNYLAFQSVLNQYRLLPESLVPVVVPLVVAVEVVCGLALLAPTAWLPWAIAPLMVAGLLSLYTAAIAVNLLRGRDAIDCGCGGQYTPLSVWLLARNGLLLTLAWSAGAASGAATQGQYLLAAAVTVFLWCAYATGNQLLANHGPAFARSPVHVETIGIRAD